MTINPYRCLQWIIIPCIVLATLAVILLMFGSPDPSQSVVAPSPGSESNTRATPVTNRGSSTRLDNYCTRSNPLGQRAESKSSSIADNYSMELVNLVLAIRHGDRSAIHTLPNATISFPQTQPQLVTPGAQPYSKFLSHLNLDVIGTGGEGEDLSHALDPTVAFHRSDFTLPQGQLTSRGFQQHLELGRLLRSAYMTYFSGIKRAEDVFVRSTNYVRTIQSVAGLLITSLPQLLQGSSVPSANEKVVVHTYADEAREIMHGVGLRSSSHGIQHPGQTSVERSGACPQAVHATKTERARFTFTDQAVAAVEEAFGPAVRDMFPPEIVDTSMPSYCHDYSQLPCAISSTGQRQCMQVPQLEALMRDADRYYCARYSGTHGGLQATQLATYPFLLELTEALLAPSNRDQSISSSSSSSAASSTTSTSPPSAATAAKSPLLTVFSGHDTVIAPVLASLGVFRQPTAGSVHGSHRGITAYCQWPGYASRIVFELFRESQEQPHHHHLRTSSSTAPPVTTSVGSKSPLDLQRLQQLHDLALNYLTQHEHHEYEHHRKPLQSPKRGLQNNGNASSTSSTSTMINNVVNGTHNHPAVKEAGHKDPRKEEQRDSEQVLNRLLQERHWIRVIFNGDDVTQYLPACRTERWILAQILVKNRLHLGHSAGDGPNPQQDQHQAARLWQLAQRLLSSSSPSSSGTAADSVGAFTLCSAHALRDYVTHDLLAPFTTFEEACRITTTD